MFNKYDERLPFLGAFFVGLGDAGWSLDCEAFCMGVRIVRVLHVVVLRYSMRGEGVSEYLMRASRDTLT
jgi:hypothetical protein